MHQNIKKKGISSDVIAAHALADMHAKFGSIANAHELFDRMPQRDVISWNAMTVGCAQNGFVEKAAETFKQMRLADVKTNSATFFSILLALWDSIWTSIKA